MNTSMSMPSAHRRAGPHGLVGFLSRIPSFEGAPRAAMEDLAGLVEPRTISRGEVLWRAGDAAGLIGVVRSGVVLLRREVADHSVTLDVLGRGAFVGLAGGIREHDAVVHDDGTLLALDRRSFERWIVAHPAVAPAVLDVAGEVGQRMAARLALVSMHGARARLAMLLLDLAGRFGVRDSRGVIVDVRLTHREMASLIGATRETVSVAIVELRNKGLIATESRRVIVVDASALEAVAGLGDADLG